MAEKLSWKRYGVDQTLVKAFEDNPILHGLTERFKDEFLHAMASAHDEMSRTMTNVLPQSGENHYCLACGMSHEAIDFFNGLAIVFAKAFMESPELRTLLFKLGYSRD
jgi:hypothetical protein